jgi:hypothetical protein
MGNRLQLAQRSFVELLFQIRRFAPVSGTILGLTSKRTHTAQEVRAHLNLSLVHHLNKPTSLDTLAKC